MYIEKNIDDRNKDGDNDSDPVVDDAGFSDEESNQIPTKSATDTKTDKFKGEEVEIQEKPKLNQVLLAGKKAIILGNLQDKFLEKLETHE